MARTNHPEFEHQGTATGQTISSEPNFVETKRQFQRTTRPEKHIPGFVNNPPAHCQCRRWERRGMICVDVLSCKMICMDITCEAYQKYLNDAHNS